MCNVRRILLRREARMKVPFVTPYRVSHLQRYGVTVRGNVTSVYPPLGAQLKNYSLSGISIQHISIRSISSNGTMKIIHYPHRNLLGGYFAINKSYLMCLKCWSLGLLRRGSGVLVLRWSGEAFLEVSATRRPSVVCHLGSTKDD